MPKQLSAGTDGSIRKSVVREVADELKKIGIESGNHFKIRTPQNTKLLYAYKKGWGVGFINASQDLKIVTKELEALAILAKQNGEVFNLFITTRTSSISPAVRKLVTGDIFIYDLQSRQFQKARFRKGMNTLNNDFLDAATLASRQLEKSKKTTSKPKRSKVNPDDIKIFSSLQGHIDEYGALRGRLKTAGNYLGIKDIGDLFEVDHLVEQRFQDALGAKGSHVTGNDMMPSKLVPRNKVIAAQIPGYNGYYHVEKTDRLKKLIPHGDEIFYSPQQIWDAHVKVLKDLGLVQEIEPMKVLFEDFEPEIKLRKVFPPGHFSKEKWIPEHVDTKKRRKRKAAKAKRKRAKTKARKKALKKNEIEAKRKKKKTRKQKIEEQGKGKVAKRVSGSIEAPDQQERLTGKDNQASSNNGVDVEELEPDKVPPTPTEGRNIKKAFSARVKPLAKLIGLATTDATDVLIGSAERIPKVKLGLGANLVIGVIVDFMFSILQGMLEKENRRGIQRDIKANIFEPLINERMNDIIEMVQSGTILDHHPTITNRWGYLVFGYTVVKQLQLEDGSDAVVSIFGGSVPEVYIKLIPSEMNTHRYWDGILHSERPKKGKQLIQAGKRKLKADNMVHYPYAQRLLVWDPEAAELYYKLRSEKVKLIKLAEETMKAARIKTSNNRFSMWSLLKEVIENYQFATAYEAIKELSPSTVWFKLKLSLKVADMIFDKPSKWSVDRRTALMLYLGVDPFKPRADIKAEKMRKRQNEIFKQKLHNPMGNKFVL